MNESIEQANKLHYAGLALVEAFIKSGGKLIKQAIVKRKIKKETINKPSRVKPADVHITNVNKFERAMKEYKQLTSVEACMYTQMSTPEMFRAARKVEDAGLITRETGKGMGGLTTFNLVC